MKRDRERQIGCESPGYKTRRLWRWDDATTEGLMRTAVLCEQSSFQIMDTAFFINQNYKFLRKQLKQVTL